MHVQEIGFDERLSIYNAKRNINQLSAMVMTTTCSSKNARNFSASSSSAVAETPCNFLVVIATGSAKKNSNSNLYWANQSLHLLFFYTRVKLLLTNFHFEQ